MGVDLLDITFRLEKAFDIRVARGDLFFDGTYGPLEEPTVWDIYLYARRRYLERYADATDGELVCDRDRRCTKCGYNLRGLTFASACPECGQAGLVCALSRAEPPSLKDLEGDVIWRTVRRVLRKALDVERSEVRPDARIVTDLGAA